MSMSPEIPIPMSFRDGPGGLARAVSEPGDNRANNNMIPQPGYKKAVDGFREGSPQPNKYPPRMRDNSRE